MKVHHASFVFLLDTEIQLQQTPRKQVGMGSPARSLRKAAFRPCWILSSSDNPHLIPAISLHHKFKGQRVSPPRQNATAKLLSPTLQLRTWERGRCLEKTWKMTQWCMRQKEAPWLLQLEREDLAAELGGGGTSATWQQASTHPPRLCLELPNSYLVATVANDPPERPSNGRTFLTRRVWKRALDVGRLGEGKKINLLAESDIVLEKNVRRLERNTLPLRAKLCQPWGVRFPPSSHHRLRKQMKETDALPTTRHRDKMDLKRAKGETQAAGSTAYPKIVRNRKRERGKLLQGDLPSLSLASGSTGEEELASKETCRTSQLWGTAV